MFGIIYKVTNLINKKIYIGQALNFVVRKKSHLNESKKEKPAQYFHKSLKKYGIENFLWEIIDEAMSKEELNEKEKYWIKFFDCLAPTGKGYNISEGGSFGSYYNGKTEEQLKEISIKQSKAKQGITPWNKGIHQSEECKRKNSEAKKGPKHPNYGKSLSKETKDRISHANSGKVRTEKMKKHQSIVHLGENNPNYGKHLNDITKQKIRDSHFGENSVNYGGMWMHHIDLKLCKLVKKEDIEQYFLKGWIKGRVLYT